MEGLRNQHVIQINAHALKRRTQHGELSEKIIVVRGRAAGQALHRAKGIICEYGGSFLQLLWRQWQLAGNGRILAMKNVALHLDYFRSSQRLRGKRNGKL